MAEERQDRIEASSFRSGVCPNDVDEGSRCASLRRLSRFFRFFGGFSGIFLCTMRQRSVVRVHAGTYREETESKGATIVGT